MTETARPGAVARAPLAGRRALVTGGSRGIGAGIVRRLAADGAAVAFTYREAKGPAHSLEQEITGSGGRAFAVQADSADPEAVRAAVSETAVLWVPKPTPPGDTHESRPRRGHAAEPGIGPGR
jgi:3-oxoacyl-[acyl-carrier protein] reductase